MFQDLNGNARLFKLKNISFHAPSEHTINGRQYDAELQIMHQSYNSSDMAVISVLFDSAKDISSCLFEKLDFSTFARINATSASKNSTTPPTGSNKQTKSGLKVPLKDYIERMGDSFYYYKGSITVPPCTEGVHWIVMSEIQYITLE